jgi:hypothetical protein
MLALQVVAGAVSNLLMIAQSSPLISGEVELKSWELLRATALPLRDIILAKSAAAIRQLRVPLIGLLVLRGISTITALMLAVYTLYRDTFYYFDIEQWRTFIQNAPRYAVPLLLPVALFLLYYTMQPVIQTVLNGALGLLASAYSPSRGRAIAAGLIGRLVLWIASILLNVALLYGGGYLIGRWLTSTYSIPGRALSSDEVVVWVLGMTIALYIASVLASQVGLIMFAFGLTQRRARRVGD